MSRFVLLAMAFLVLETACSAFLLQPVATTSCHHHHRRDATPLLHLVPEQGRQLVAFSQDYLSKRADESAHRASNLTTSPRRRHSDATSSHQKSNSPGFASAAKSLVTRLLGQGEVKGSMMENHSSYMNDEMDSAAKRDS